jgi:hypothetical protein
MTSEQAKKFIAAYPGAKNFVKPSHLEELSPLLECHVEAIVCRKDEFHDISGAFMPRKETLDKFAQAAGVSYNQLAETTRKEGDGCYIGTAQSMVMGPDGKMIMGPICEYEFDVDVRLEELKLKGKADWDNKIGNRPGTREYTERELATERVQLMKVGRMRANTGARNRATMAILGMQTGFKGLFEKGASDHVTITFLFSRIIVNAKNEMVLNRMLDNIAGPTQALFGSPPVAAIAGRAEPADLPMRNATPPDDFDDFTSDPPAADERLTRLVAAISEWTLCEDQRIAKRAQAIIDRGESNPDVLEPSLALLSYLGNGGRTGANVCIQALDDAPDVANLKSLVEKVNKAKAS